MTDKTLFDANSESKAYETFEYDEDGDKVIINHRQDVTATLERNKARQNAEREKGEHWELMADIPVGVLYEWLTKYGVDFFNKNHAAGVNRLLNSNEYRYIRVNKLIL